MSDTGASSDEKPGNNLTRCRTAWGRDRNVLKQPRARRRVTRPRPRNSFKPPWSGHRTQGRVPRPFYLQFGSSDASEADSWEGRGPSAGLRIRRYVTCSG